MQKWKFHRGTSKNGTFSETFSGPRCVRWHSEILIIHIYNLWMKIFNCKQPRIQKFSPASHNRPSHPCITMYFVIKRVFYNDKCPEGGFATKSDVGLHSKKWQLREQKVRSALRRMGGCGLQSLRNQYPPFLGFREEFPSRNKICEKILKCKKTWGACHCAEAGTGAPGSSDVRWWI